MSAHTKYETYIVENGNLKVEKHIEFQWGDFPLLSKKDDSKIILGIIDVTLYLGTIGERKWTIDPIMTIDNVYFEPSSVSTPIWNNPRTMKDLFAEAYLNAEKGKRWIFDKFEKEIKYTILKYLGYKWG